MLLTFQIVEAAGIACLVGAGDTRSGLWVRLVVAVVNLPLAVATAIGAAGVTFYAVFWAAASSDIIATHFKLTMEGVIHTLQALLFVGPVVAYFLTKRICIALAKKDRSIALHGYETGRIVKLPGGEFIEVHEQLSDYER